MNKKLISLSALITVLPVVTVVSCVSGKPNSAYVTKANEEQQTINNFLNENVAPDKITVPHDSINLIDKNQQFTTDEVDHNNVKIGFKKAEQIFKAIGFEIDLQNKIDNDYSYFFLIGRYTHQTEQELAFFEVNIRVMYKGSSNLSSIIIKDADNKDKDVTVVPFKIIVERHNI